MLEAFTDSVAVEAVTFMGMYTFWSHFRMFLLLQMQNKKQLESNLHSHFCEASLIYL